MLSQKLQDDLMSAYQQVHEAKRGHAARDSDVEKQASQLASDVRYKAKGKVKEGASEEEKKKIFMQILGASPAPTAVKSMAKQKLLGEETVQEMRFNDGKSKERLEALAKKRGIPMKKMKKHPQFQPEEFAKTGMAKGDGMSFPERLKKKAKEKKMKMEGYMSKDKYTHDTGGFRISQKDADEAKERIKKKTAAKMKKEEFVDEKRLVHGNFGNFISGQKKETPKRDTLTPKDRYKIPEGMDPVGKEDKDIDNDGDHDSTDKYLLKRRKAIGKAIAKKRGKVKEGFSAWRIDLDFNEQVKK